MKQNEIEIGATYVTLVSGQETRVRVIGPAVEPYSPMGRVRRAEFPVENLKTGNRLKRTAAALRRRVLEGSELLQAFVMQSADLGGTHELLKVSERTYLDGRPYTEHLYQVRFPLVAMPARDELIAWARKARCSFGATIGKVGTSAEGTCSALIGVPQ